VADTTLLVAEMAQLKDEIARLNRHKFVSVHNSTTRMLVFQFARGLAFGFGTVIGATILVSVLGYLLSSVDFIPIIGEWAAEVLRIIDTGG